MRRIAFVFSTLNTGGVQRSFSEIITHLPDDWEIDIILNDAKNICYPYKGNIIDLGFKPQKNKKDIVYQLRVFIRRFRMLRKLKMEKKYDACISALESANVANILSGKHGTKVIVSVHSCLSAREGSKLDKYIINPLVRRLYNKADQVVAVSNGIARDLEGAFRIRPDKLRTIPNGIELTKIEAKMLEPLSDQEKEWFRGSSHVLVTAGRLETPKAFWHLIRALREIKTKIADVRLIILGEGSQEDYLRQLADMCGVKENVIFAGFRENPFRLFHAGNMVVMSSLYEGLPYVLVEALACQKACVATDFHSGARQVLGYEEMEPDLVGHWVDAPFGVLTPVCDGKQYTGADPVTREEQLLADAIVALFQDRVRYEEYQQKASKRAADFDINNLIKEWMKLVEEGGERNA